MFIIILFIILFLLFKYFDPYIDNKSSPKLLWYNYKGKRKYIPIWS